MYRLQKRIESAASRGDVQVVHNVQRKLMRSSSGRLLAVRRVTQDNQGKQTAGVDGKTALTASERFQLVEKLAHHHTKRRKPLPVRRVWIPKPGKAEKRPLGIPTIRDRAEQALAKQALEPEWEAKFEPGSYGFRPGRSVHDAIAASFLSSCKQPKYVFDADIAGCFDTIAHAPLLAKLQTFPAMRRTIKGWLKAGVLEAGVLAPTEAGTPQGGCISPLLAKIALHGMEQAVKEGDTLGKSRAKPKLIRYADDFVVRSPTREGIERAKDVVQGWLTEMGLELKPSKTRICHTLDPLEESPPGFDFLGFNVRQYRVGKYRSGRHNGRLLGFKTLIKPSQSAITRQVEKLRQTIRKARGAWQEQLISDLNPQISGWATYFKTVVAKHCFSRMDDHLYHMLWKWAKWRHKNKGGQWRKQKYWRTTKTRSWVFAASENLQVTRHSQVKIKRPVKVEGTASPYNGALVYWAKRTYEHPLTRTRVGYVLRLQQGRCAACGLYLTDADVLELDHFIPKRLGGTDALSNLQVLHRHCHDRKTAQEGSTQSRADGLLDNELDS